MEIIFPSNENNNISKTTYLGVGAHHDDLEIMAPGAVLDCRHSSNLTFAGVVCTSGSGSSRAKEHEQLSAKEYSQLRQQEQIQAAQLGGYNFVAQLKFESGDIKSTMNVQLVNELAQIIEQSEPTHIFTHNLFDKHPTHVAVALHVVEAIKTLNLNREIKLIGCEVWRGLEWVPNRYKLVQDLTGAAPLVKQMISCYQSQASDNKDYVEATLGRFKANATYHESHAKDQSDLLSFNVDMSELIAGASVENYVNKYLDAFKSDLQNNFTAFGVDLWK